MQELLDRAWGDREYYLGEWHYHPGSSPKPSSKDIGQMKRISESEGYNAPEPILVVIGDITHENSSVVAHVFPRGQELVRLTQTGPAESEMYNLLKWRLYCCRDP